VITVAFPSPHPAGGAGHGALVAPLARAPGGEGVEPHLVVVENGQPHARTPGITAHRCHAEGRVHDVEPTAESALRTREEVLNPARVAVRKGSAEAPQPRPG